MQVQVSLTIEIGATADLAEMEQQIQDLGQQAMREALKQAIRHWEDQQQACPHCGATQRRLEVARRELAQADLYRYQVTNQTVQQAVEEILSILGTTNPEIRKPKSETSTKHE